MSPAQTALIFAGIPLAVVIVFALMIWGPSEMRQPNRYRPGKPWPYRPVWYLPQPTGRAGTSGATQAITAPSRPAIESREEAPAPTPTAVGGASGEW